MSRLRLAVGWLCAVVALVLVGTLLPASAATANDIACRALIKTSDGTSTAELLVYDGCRFDKLDAAVKTLGTPTATPSPSQTPKPSTSPTPTVTPKPSTTPAPSPTPSTSTSTPPTSAKCVGAANTPGGADPWGGCWPGPQNTGYPHGVAGDTRAPVTLTDYNAPGSEPIEVRTCGLVIDGKRVNSSIVILASNGTHSAATPCVTIKNSLVKGVIYSEATNQGPVVVTDTEIAPEGLPYLENIGRSNVFATRIDNHGGAGGFRCQAYCEVRDSYLHGARLGGAYHYNAIGGNGMGAGSFNIQHNWASCGDWESVDPAVQDDAGCSSDIGFYGDFDPVQNIAIYRNFLPGMRIDPKVPNARTRQPGYLLNPGYYPGKPYPAPKNVAVTDNVFGRGSEGKGGVFGPTNSLNARGATNGNTWSGNRYDDGEAIARVEE